MKSLKREGSEVRYRPICGGVFGDGRYVMATMPSTDRGLHAVRFMVLEPKAGAVLAISHDKRQALADSRRLLRATKSLEVATKDAVRNQGSLWPVEDLPVPDVRASSRSVPRRRLEVFERSQGKCFYCGKVLSLDGRWHVEHQMPRALMGPDELPNLVAACEDCNWAKGDRTALEFIAKLPPSGSLA